MSILDEIANERQRQIKKEGWSIKHDNKHKNGELSIAAACYALSAAGWKRTTIWEIWPAAWGLDWLKPKSSRRDLIRAAALIVAEIERLDRIKPKEEKNELHSSEI